MNMRLPRWYYGPSIQTVNCAGTNQLRVQKGKTALGSVSLDICMEWERNFIVSHWIDIDAKLYDEYGSKAGKTLPNMDFGQWQSATGWTGNIGAGHEAIELSRA